MSLGAEKAGIQVISAVEINKYFSRTYTFNFRKTQIIQEDIRKVDPENMMRRPFILFGGPPCQGFSISFTKRNEDFNNLRNGMFKEFIRFTAQLKPDWFVFENVEGFSRFHKGKLANELSQAMTDIGYKNLFADVLNSADFGVPQIRKRFFMIGNNKGIPFNISYTENKTVTVGEALSDLPSLKNGDKTDELPYKNIELLSGYAELMRHNSKSAKQNYVSKNKDYVIERYKYIKQGQNWSAIPDELIGNYKDKNRCHTGIYRRLDPEKPSVVIANYRKNMLIHPFEDRGLSIREAARLQSFHDDFIFQGTLDSMQQQIGNAVPPL